MAQTLQLSVSRSSNLSPWGIRLHGGREYMCPITIQRVADESPAASAGLRAGDVLVAVNGHDVSKAAQTEAQRLISGAGNAFNLTITRGGLYTKITTPHHTGSGSLGVPSSGKKRSESPYRVLEDPNPRGQTFSTVAKPTVRSQQYNNPSKLYSDSNIRDVMEKHSEELGDGVRGVNFKKPGSNKEEPTDNLANSGALQMLRELEASGGKLEPLKPAFKTVHVAAPHHLQQPSQSPAMAKITKGPVSQASAQWEKKLNADQAGAADNAADFTKKFVSDFYNNDSNKTASLPRAPTFNPSAPANIAAPRQQTYYSYQPPKSSYTPPAQRPTSGGNWKQTLDANKAGAAGNAADFTKQFMSDFYGNSDSSNTSMAAPMAAPKAPMAAPKAPMAAPKAPMAPLTAPAAAPVPSSDSAGPNLHWERTLASNKAGVASNAADFTKQFMSDMYSKPVNSAPQKPVGHVAFNTGPSQAPRAPAKSGEPGKWSDTLNANKAGAASNAADFTKQFMSDFYGQSNATSSQPSSILKSGNTSSYSSQSTSSITRESYQTTAGDTERRLVGPASRSSALKSSLSALKSSLSTASKTSLGPGQLLLTPKRGVGVVQRSETAGRIPKCGCGCDTQIRGPFITAGGKDWCPTHFKCARNTCGLSLQESGFVEEQENVYCEQCFVSHLAPVCSKCTQRIPGPCLKAMHTTFHPECFVCASCARIFANAPFYMEDGLPYCEKDWHDIFTTKCISCGFPIEAGDKWVEAVGENYHTQCFNCMLCKRNLEGMGFFVKAGKPFCKEHASRGF